MNSKVYGRVFTFLVLLGAVLMVSSGYAFEPPGQYTALPQHLSESIQRSLASRPGDLFVVLKNGLTVLLRQQPGNDVVSTQVFVHAGSIYEGEHLTAGLSHYLEHVVSGGSTRSFSEAQAKERLQRLGGAGNAYTTMDRTVYYITTSVEHWKDSLDLLLSYVSQNILDPQEVAREKAVIQQEIKMGQNSPESELWKMFMNTAYEVSPVRNPVIGYEEVFVRQDREALLNYYNQRYQPENMVLAMVGNINPLEVLGFVCEKIKGFERKANPFVVLPDEPLQMGPRWVEKEHPVARMAQAMIGFPSVSLNHEDVYALDVLALLLGEGQTSRLAVRLKDRESQVLSVSASNWTPSYVHGQFIISLTMSSEYWPGVLKSMGEEIERFKKELVSSEDLEKSKKTAIAQHVFGKETASSQASDLASSFFDTGLPYFGETYVEELRRVTGEQIRDVAQRYLDMGRVNVALIRPPKASANADSEPSFPASSTKSSVRYSQLDNGLKLLIKRDASLPRVTLQLYGLGGLYLEDPKQAGLSAFTASLLTSGTRKRNKLDIARAIEDVGGAMESKSDNNTYHVAAKVLKEDLPMALDVLSDVVLDAQFPQEEMEKRRKETLLALQRLDENWQAEVLRLFKKKYFQRSPYEHDRMGTVESVKSFGRDDVLAFYHRMVNPHHSVLAIYGDIDPEKVELSVREKLGAWKEQPITLPDFPEETHMIVSDQTVEKKNEKVSAALFIGTNGLAIESSKRPVLDVLDAVLSGAGLPGGRLFDALRGGKEDLVYVVSAFPFYGKKAGYFGVLTQTTLANLDRVQSIVQGHLKRLSDEPVPADELKIAKDMILTAQRLARESLDAQAQSATVNEALGLGWDYDERLVERIQSVSAEQVQMLARELFANLLVARTIPERPVEILPTPASKHDVQAP